MANPYTPGTEAYKLFAYATSKGNSEKAAGLFAEHHRGRGYFDVSGGTAVAKTNLPVSSATVAHGR
jgi:hypothetical protein